MLKRVGAELFGALARGAVGIETDVGIEIVEERGVVLLLKVDNSEQAVDDRLLRGDGARLFSAARADCRWPREIGEVEIPPLLCRAGSSRLKRKICPPQPTCEADLARTGLTLWQGLVRGRR